MPASLLITGATGHLGGTVIEQLLTHVPAERIAALARDEAKAAPLAARGVDVRIGTYDDAASLAAAMEGVETVLLISGTDEGDRMQQHRNVIDAAKAAGVHTFAYTGRNLRDRATLRNDLMTEHFETEDLIRASGMTAVLFQNALYTDVLPQFVGGARVFETGIQMPTGDGRGAFALRSELGEAIGNALAEDHTDDRVYRLTGSEAWSMDDVAQALSARVGPGCDVHRPAGGRVRGADGRPRRAGSDRREGGGLPGRHQERAGGRRHRRPRDAPRPPARLSRGRRACCIRAVSGTVPAALYGAFGGAPP